MRILGLILVIAVIFCLTAQPASSQVCGDVNGDSLVNLSDVIVILDHIGSNTNSLPDTALAEFDGMIGITIGDATQLVKYIFQGSGSITCGASSSYTFPISTNDTVFIPRVLSVPDGINDLRMPFKYSLDSSTSSLYLPLIPNTVSPSVNHFNLDPVDGISFQGGGPMLGIAPAANGMNPSAADTLIIQIVELPTTAQIVDSFPLLHYERIEPGIADIEPGWTDRSPLLRVAIEKSGMVYVPVVMYYDFVLPPDTLYASPASLSYSAFAGDPSIDSFYITLNSAQSPNTVDLVPSQPWIRLNGQPQVTVTTPDSVLVTIDVLSMTIGSHTGTIDLLNVDPLVVLTTSSIIIDATIVQPFLFPAGDLNCDGAVDIADLTMLITFLFINGPQPEHCQ